MTTLLEPPYGYSCVYVYYTTYFIVLPRGDMEKMERIIPPEIYIANAIENSQKL